MEPFNVQTPEPICLGWYIYARDCDGTILAQTRIYCCNESGIRELRRINDIYKERYPSAKIVILELTQTVTVSRVSLTSVSERF